MVSMHCCSTKRARLDPQRQALGLQMLQHLQPTGRVSSCTELRDVTICPTSLPSGRERQLWQAIAALGRLHGDRLQLQVPAHSFLMLEAEPSLAAHVSQTELPGSWSADAGSSLANQVRSLSSLTKLTLNNRHTERGELTIVNALFTLRVNDQDSVLGGAGMLDALRQLSALQSLHCPGDVMQTLLVNSVPRSWSLLTKLQFSRGTLMTRPRDAQV